MKARRLLPFFSTAAFLSGLVFLTAPSEAATVIPFTVTLSESVVVNTSGGIPFISIDVGGATRHAVYASGSGTNSLVFNYTLQSGDVDADGVAVSSPIQLNGGTIKDINGNNAVLSFTPPNSSGVIVNAAVPSGYSVAFADDTVTNSNKTSLSFSITSPKVNRTYSYSITSSGGGSPLTGSGTLTVSPQTISGINVSTLPDGVLTLSLTLSDSLGGTGSAATDTIPMAVLTAGLLGHWTLDAHDISGTTVLDRSGNGRNGTLVNGPTLTSGVVGGGVTFDGLNDYMTVPSISGIRSIVISGQISSVQNAACSSWHYLFDARTGLTNGWFANQSIGTDWTGMNINGTASSPTYSFPKDSFVVLYFQANASFTDDINFMSRYSNNECTAGRLDDVRVYSTTLTAAQVAMIYATH